MMAALDRSHDGLGAVLQGRPRTRPADSLTRAASSSLGASRGSLQQCTGLSRGWTRAPLISEASRAPHTTPLLPRE
jgi:hypothetical protein